MSHRAKPAGRRRRRSADIIARRSRAMATCASVREGVFRRPWLRPRNDADLSTLTYGLRLDEEHRFTSACKKAMLLLVKISTEHGECHGCHGRQSHRTVSALATT